MPAAMDQDQIMELTTSDEHTTSDMRTTSDKRPTGFRALLIGIDNYAHGGQTGFRNLSGCVADVNDMKDFLKETMKVSPSCITTLLNEEATRCNIIEKMKDLSIDNAIQPHDPILIYYAGHGAETSAPAGWHAGGPGVKIQMIVPYDFNPHASDENKGGIYDIVLAARLSVLAKAKGNNIVGTITAQLTDDANYFCL
jgi:hypothetical protein